MQVKPLADRVLVKALAETETSKSGIIIPTTVEKERPERGEIIAVGPGKLLENGTRVPLSVKVGDKIIFKKYGPDEVKIDGQDMFILEEGDILGIIE
jgi:chaperonin GroES